MHARLAAVILALAGTAFADPHQSDRTVTSLAHPQQQSAKESKVAQAPATPTATPQVTPVEPAPAAWEAPIQLGPLPRAFGPRPEGPRTSFPGTP